MKKILPGLLLGLVLGAGATWLLLRSSAPAPAPEKPAAAETEKSPAAPGVHLTPEQIATAGVQVAPPAVVTLAPEIQAYGRVLDSTPLVAAAAEIATAQAALTASAKEFARTRSLHDEGDNASVQAVEAAQAAAQRDRVALASARARFTAAWGPALAARLDSGLVTAAVEKGWALARIDVPPGETLAADLPATAKVSLLGETSRISDAEVIGPAATADPQLQGRGYLVLVRDQSLPAGAALHAILPGAGAAAPRPVLPRRAFVRHEGSVFVYVQTGAGIFLRRRVELGAPLAAGVAVDAGIGAKDPIVVVGAQQLLSTELGAAGGGGD